MLRRILASTRIQLALAMAGLFALNLYVSQGFLTAEYTNQVGSVDGAFMSFSRWLADHPDDRSWFPMWIAGTPTRQVYNPLLHLTTAEIARLADWSTPRVYHFLTGIGYSLAPVALFWLCFYATRRVAVALVAGLVYSLFSPANIVFSEFRYDVGSLWFAKRFQNLALYGEGPHTMGLAMIPVVLWILDRASLRSDTPHRWVFLLFAPVALAVMVLTNWTGTTGLALAVIAYALSKLGLPKGTPRLQWSAFAGIGIVGYLLAAPGVPPSLILTMQRASATLDVPITMAQKLTVIAPLAMALIILHVLFTRFGAGPWLRFFVYYALICLGVVGGKLWAGYSIVPIAHRFHVEMEIGIVGALAIASVYLADRLPRRAVIATVCVLAIAGVAQARTYRRYADSISTPLDFTTTPDYRMAKWFDANMNGQRVFAPGTVSFWMNLFTDTPQLIGCCDQSIRTDEFRIAGYVIYSGEGTGDRDGEIAAMWLRAYGVAAVGVTGTQQWGQPYGNPRKFEGVLPEVWRDGESAVYRVAGPEEQLAHVMNRSSLIARHPVNGIDIEPLQPFLEALNHPRFPSTFRWLNQHEAEIAAETAPDQVIHIQETYDSGWHATESGRELTITPDVLGLMTIEPLGAGLHTIRLRYTGNREDYWAQVAQIAGVALLLLWAGLVYRRGRRTV